MKTNASLSLREKHVREVMKLLKKEYPHATIALKNWKNPWELLVAVILSAQCTDVLVNIVTEKLFVKYPTLDSYVKASLAVFEQDIKSTGFFRNKAKNILGAAKIVKTKFKGKVPRTMAELTLLPGVARKTANVVLGNAFGIVEGIAVDTHVQRLSQRLRLVDLMVIGGKHMMTFTKGRKTIVDFKKDADPNKIEQQLMAVVPKSDWFPLTYMVIDHGRAVCKAQRPHCSECMLSGVCPSSRV